MNEVKYIINVLILKYKRNYFNRLNYCYLENLKIISIFCCDNMTKYT